MRVLSLRTAPERHLIKIRTFLRKIDSHLEKYIFGPTNLKLFLIKHQNFVREPFQVCSKIRILLDLKHLNLRIFSFILHHKHPNNLF